MIQTLRGKLVETTPKVLSHLRIHAEPGTWCSKKTKSSFRKRMSSEVLPGKDMGTRVQDPLCTPVKKQHPNQAAFPGLF